MVRAAMIRAADCVKFRGLGLVHGLQCLCAVYPQDAADVSTRTHGSTMLDG